MVAGGFEMLVAIGKTAGAVSSLAKKSPWVIRQAKRNWYRLTKGTVLIPIFGAGGAGKSTLSKIIAGMHPSDAATTYKESLWTEVVPLNGDIPGDIKVAPGQAWRKDNHWPRLFKEISGGKCSGIINVVSYGHHSIPLPSLKSLEIWDEQKTIAENASSYLDSRRAVEIELLKHLVSGLAALTDPIWMATIITKQDFWAYEQEKVLTYYKDGEYGAQIDALASRLGSYGFQHEFIPTSLTISNLQAQDGEVLIETERGFDIPARDRALKAMAEKIELLVSK